MVEYIRGTRYSPKMKKQAKLQPGSWVRIEKPTDNELSQLTEQLKLDEVIIHDALDPHEVPRVEVEDDNLYFITRLPDTDSTTNDFTTPLMLIITRTQVVTISRNSHSRLWERFIERSNAPTTQQTKLFLTMMEAVVGQYQRRMDAINRQMRAATEDITTLKPRDITIFVEYERKLNDYMDALIPTNVALEKFLSGRLHRLYEDDRELVEDLSIDAEQLIVRCKSMLRTITNVRDSYRALMDTRLNETIRLLTVITVALTIPTMVAGLYGMNVDIPGNESDPSYFYLITLSSLVGAFLLSYYFLKKRQ